LFIREEQRRSDGGVLSQGIMYVLNDNGFPNMSIAEAVNASRFCRSLIIHQEVMRGVDSESQNDALCHFYSNDLKILLEMVIRELVNIPCHREEFERLRIW
jgi:hypothetical protein